jgi:hypothetical protein
MRTRSFMLAVAFVFVGPSMAGSSESSLPGIGTFAYRVGVPTSRDCSPLRRSCTEGLPERRSCFFGSVQQ